MLRSNAYRPDPPVRRTGLALRQAGYEVEIIAWDREGARPRREVMDGLKVHRIRLRAGYDRPGEFLAKLPRVWLRMLHLLGRAEAAVIHCYDLDTLPVGLVAARLKHIPCVFDARELYSAMVEEGVPPLVHRVLRWLERTLARRADLLLTANETYGRLYEGMGASPVVVVMNTPMEEELADRDGGRVRSELGLREERIGLYLGTLERSRNLPTLIESFASLPEEGVVLVIGGGGTLVEEVRRHVAGVKNVRFVGWVDAREKASYLDAADVVLLLDDPSYPINRLAVSTRLLEALALGVPVLASEGTASAEIIREEEVGLIVAHDNIPRIQSALHRLLSDQALRVTATRNGLRATQERYNWPSMRKRLLEAYAWLRPLPTGAREAD